MSQEFCSHLTFFLKWTKTWHYGYYDLVLFHAACGDIAGAAESPSVKCAGAHLYRSAVAENVAIDQLIVPAYTQKQDKFTSNVLNQIH